MPPPPRDTPPDTPKDTPREPLRERIRKAAEGQGDPRQRRETVARLRAAEVRQSFADHPGRNLVGHLTVPTRNGDVQIGRVDLTEVDGVAAVDVYLADGSPDPHYRIVNPPTLAEDPAGGIVIGGRRFREDPVLAVAQVIAGERASKRKGARR